jgi:hypothetical protein
VIGLNPQPLARVYGPEPLLQPAEIRVVHGASPGG